MHTQMPGVRTKAVERHHRLRRLAAAATAAALTLAACGSDDSDAELTSSTAPDAEAGSSTVSDVAETTAPTDAGTSDDASSGDAVHGDGPAPDRFIYAWHLGMPMRPMAITPAAYGGEGPDAPADDIADVTVYLVGPTDERNPVGPEREIPGPDGGLVVLPPHEQVHDQVVDASDPHDAIGVFVTAGPTATDDTVRTRAA